jgi:phosphoribosylaminoimidazolecarboxamide formyltransferase/IMP cyclohydrolase
MTGTYALVSVADKSGIVALARGLNRWGIEVIATSGTARVLSYAAIDATEIAAVTRTPELMGGRVKALHPLIFGGLLCRWDHAADEADARALGVPRIGVLACNFADLPPPEGRRSDRPEDLYAATALIDIGGPAMVRAAVKNAAHVLPVVDPADYPSVLDAMHENRGDVASVGPGLREYLVRKAAARTAAYDHSVHRLVGMETPESRPPSPPVSVGWL